jgi:hypothetical protein
MQKLTMKKTHKTADGLCIEGLGLGGKVKGTGFIVIAENSEDLAKIGALLGITITDPQDVKGVALFMGRDCR